MAATNNPNETTFVTPPPPISSKLFYIAGIVTNVYGLEELPSPCDTVSVLWLLHARLQTKETMEPTAATILHAWNKHRASTSGSKNKGLIAVAFDQRNHGTREVSAIANEAWRSGNERHAQDMFSVFHGTAMDTSLLIDHLGSYVFNERDAPRIEKHFALGVSLGGHATWQLFLSEPRIDGAVVIIGCPDYIRVMTDRARLSKRNTYTKDDGATFLGSTDFPRALIASVKKWDPKGLLFGTAEIIANPSAQDQAQLRPILDSNIKGKSLLCCSGSADKLVPYQACKPFLEFLKNATKKGGWYEDGNVRVEDLMYDGVGHVFTQGMVKDSIRFIKELMEGKNIARARI